MAGELMRVSQKRAAPKPKAKRRKRGLDTKPLIAPKFEVLSDGAHAVTIPVHTECFVNGSQGMSRGASFAAARAKKKQRDTVAHYLFGVGIAFRGIKLVRLAPSEGLDTGNLWNALKAVQDEIAAHLGVDDGPSSPASWDVGQEREDAYGVRVELRLERVLSAVEARFRLGLVQKVVTKWSGTESVGLLLSDIEAALRGAA